jgi:heme-degrading monooxygenase HmoA
MIARFWTGVTRATDAESYEAYMRALAMPGYSNVAGNRAVLMLRRDLDAERTEFTMVTLWDSIQAIEAFTGPDVERAVFYDEDEHFLIERELVARHFEVYDSQGLAAPA